MSATRAPGRRRAVPGWVSLAACLLAIMLINGLVRASDPGGVRYYDGRAGETVAGRQLTVTVDAVYLTRRVAGVVEFETPHQFVVVTWHATAHERPLGLARVELHTEDGRVYGKRDEMGSADIPPLPARFTGRGASVFELPPDRAQGADFVVGPEVEGIGGYVGAVRIADVVTPATPTLGAFSTARASLQVSP